MGDFPAPTDLWAAHTSATPERLRQCGAVGFGAVSLLVGNSRQAKLPAQRNTQPRESCCWKQLKNASIQYLPGPQSSCDSQVLQKPVPSIAQIVPPSSRCSRTHGAVVSDMPSCCASIWLAELAHDSDAIS
jgi:hypothetical protein